MWCVKMGTSPVSRQGGAGLVRLATSAVSVRRRLLSIIGTPAVSSRSIQLNRLYSSHVLQLNMNRANSVAIVRPQGSPCIHAIRKYKMDTHTQLLRYNINITPRISHYGSSTDKDYYTILGVSKSASAKEIKSAYFERAKQVHPDMCPNDPIAAKKFKEVSEAYTVLKDDSSRSAYDAHRASPFTRNQGFNADQQQQYAQQQQQQAWNMNASGVDAEEIFKGVWKDLGFSEIKDYLTRVREEGEDAMSSIRENNDFGPAWQFTKEYKGLITGIVLPLALTLRFPALVGLAMRNLFLIPVVIMRALPPQLRWRLMHDLWFRIVKSQQAHSHTDTEKEAKGKGRGRRRR